MFDPTALFDYVISKISGAYTDRTVLAGVLFILAVLAVGFIRRRGAMGWSRRKVESFLASLTIFHLNFLFVPFVWLAALWLQAAYEVIGLPRGDPQFWPQMPGWVTVIAAIFFHDFANYWNHRAMHLKWLWPIHAIHH
ncbi:MAG TPA: hypothetical protein PKE65_01090, partial [Rhizobiaceae bacterium]|nr:hypothetical protein [Rhizobiaceae bacterium]